MAELADRNSLPWPRYKTMDWTDGEPKHVWPLRAHTHTHTLWSDWRDQELHSTQLVRAHAHMVSDHVCVQTLARSAASCSNVSDGSACVTFVGQDVCTCKHAYVWVCTCSFIQLCPTRSGRIVLWLRVCAVSLFGGWNAEWARGVSHSCYAWSAVIRASTPLPLSAASILSAPFQPFARLLFRVWWKVLASTPSLTPRRETTCPGGRCVAVQALWSISTEMCVSCLRSHLY